VHIHCVGGRFGREAGEDRLIHFPDTRIGMQIAVDGETALRLLETVGSVNVVMRLEGMEDEEEGR
jgi:hypothetical protein